MARTGSSVKRGVSKEIYLLACRAEERSDAWEEPPTKYLYENA